MTNTEDIKNYFANDNFINLVGAKLIDVKDGYAKAELVIEDKHLNAHGVVQGGVFFTLADLALGAASASYGNINLAVQASINFLRPAKTGDKLTAEAEELSKGRRVSNYQIKIYNQNGKVVTSFIGVAYDKQTPLFE